jgi:hypothetical protein
MLVLGLSSNYYKLVLMVTVSVKMQWVGQVLSAYNILVAKL